MEIKEIREQQRDKFLKALEHAKAFNNDPEEAKEKVFEALTEYFGNLGHYEDVTAFTEAIKAIDEDYYNG